MSADNHFETIVKGIANGATFYMTKPLKMDMLSTIWQHVLRMSDDKLLDASKILSLKYNGKLKDRNKGTGFGGSRFNIDDYSKKRREEEIDKEEDDEDVEENDDSAKKKRRILWTTDLHEKFIKAVNRIGIHSIYSLCFYLFIYKFLLYNFIFFTLFFDQGLFLKKFWRSLMPQD